MIQVLALRAFVELDFKAGLLHLLDYALGEPSAESPESFSHVWIHIYSGTSLTIKLAMDKICWARLGKVLRHSLIACCGLTC